MVAYVITTQLTQSIDHAVLSSQIMRAGGVFWQSCGIAWSSYASACIKPHYRRGVCCAHKLRSLLNETGYLYSPALSSSEKRKWIN